MDLGVTWYLDHAGVVPDRDRTTLTFPRTTWHLAAPSEGDAVPQSEDDLKATKSTVAGVPCLTIDLPSGGT